MRDEHCATSMDLAKTEVVFMAGTAQEVLKQTEQKMKKTLESFGMVSNLVMKKRVSLIFFSMEDLLEVLMMTNYQQLLGKNLNNFEIQDLRLLMLPSKRIVIFFFKGVILFLFIIPFHPFFKN